MPCHECHFGFAPNGTISEVRLSMAREGTNHGRTVIDLAGPFGAPKSPSPLTPKFRDEYASPPEYRGRGNQSVVLISDLKRDPSIRPPFNIGDEHRQPPAKLRTAG